ncbi:hypothetical protein GCM10012275_35800 [Longimycelium tulufanense]|uniref:Uncharacterized protein n=1 Tax=Longimycelium tulufanense TaxID=907463 RepID=A0A8J3CG30_9PSEU|nr:DUF6218 family protein [Longimycelium tulufanense]GGM61705.1 hypothetical protein GCM10012275_35800 [Longimycelium tulufanense]
MTADLQTSRPLATVAADGRTMLGHVVLGRGAGHDGRDALAVWQMSPDGLNTGAWVKPVEKAFDDAGTAGELLDAAFGRLVVAWDPEPAVEILRRLAETVPARHLDPAELSLRDALRQVAEVREVCDKRVAEERQQKKNITPLEWNFVLPDPLPHSAEEFRRSVGLVRPHAACPAATDVLTTCHLLTWCVQAWQDTATAIARRDYLRQSLGEPHVLPAGWEKLLADTYLAAATRTHRTSRQRT